MTESVDVPRWSSDPTGPAEELAADRLFVAPCTAMVHATDDDDDDLRILAVVCSYAHSQLCVHC